jgi:hypothetical protein
MPAISKKQVGTEARRATKAGRFYEIVSGDPYPSVKTILQIVNKPALIPWAAKMERLAVMAVAADMFEEMSKPMVIASGIKRDTYLSLLESRIGKAKASQKELEAAGEIGSQTHSYIEWHLAKLMGGKVGPAPKIDGKALWAFMSFEDWAKSIELLPLRSEQVIFSHKHRYAGTMDLLAWIMKDGQRRLALIDFKTGKAIYSEAYMQLAAYREALVEMGLEVADVCMVLRLPKIDSDPEFEVVEVPDIPQHFEAFLAARDLWHWSQARELEYKIRSQKAKEEACL